MTEQLQFSGSVEINGVLVRGELSVSEKGMVLTIVDNNGTALSIMGKDLNAIKNILSDAGAFIKTCEL